MAALPTDFLSVSTLQTLKLQAEFASAAYRSGGTPAGYRDVNLANIGVDESHIDGRFFENNGAAARVLTDGQNWVLAFRGTNSVDDLLDYLDDGDDYIDNFDNLLDALATVNIAGTFSVTGHSLGGAAVHQLAGKIADYGGEFRTANYYSFASPIFDSPGRVGAYGIQNDAVYSYDTDVTPPYVRNVYWWTGTNEIDQVDITDSDNDAAHSIVNHIGGLDRMIRTEMFDPQWGLTDERGLDLSVTTILSGSHDRVDITDIRDGTMVFLGVDGRLDGEGRGEAVLADEILGRSVIGDVDWIDGMRGNDFINGRYGVDHLFGSSGNDTLEGGRGRDYLNGGAQVDTLEGGAGSDRFFFSAKQGAPDIVLDFHAIAGTAKPAERDQLVIDASVFGGDKGPLDFVNGDDAQDAREDRATVIYARSSGNVLFDPDGTGAKAAVLIATLEDGPSLLQDGDVRLI